MFSDYKDLKMQLFVMFNLMVIGVEIISKDLNGTHL